MKNRGAGCCLIAVLLVAGCGPSGPVKPKLYPVSGKVTVGGKPLTDCTVQFTSTGADGGGYTGKLDANGEYKLSDPTDNASGAAAGKYKVSFQVDPAAAMKAMSSMAPGGTGGPPTVTAPFPPEYAKTETSPKEVEVTPTTSTINIEIP